MSMIGKIEARLLDAELSGDQHEVDVFTALLDTFPTDEVVKHYGPGPHKGTGTPQTVHSEGQQAGRFTALVDELHTSALDVEAAVTPILEKVAEASGGEFYGFEWRVKTAPSIASKMRRNMSEALAAGTPITVETAALGVTDLNRYTLRWDNDEYNAGVLAAVDALESDGWELFDHSAKNAWVPNNLYNGINTKFIKDDNIFELQFHTVGSTRIKAQSDLLYARVRELPDNDPERKRIVKEIHALWNVDTSHIPAGAAHVYGEQKVFAAKALAIVWRYFNHYNERTDRIDITYRVGGDRVELFNGTTWVASGLNPMTIAGHGGDAYHETSRIDVGKHAGPGNHPSGSPQSVHGDRDTSPKPSPATTDDGPQESTAKAFHKGFAKARKGPYGMFLSDFDVKHFKAPNVRTFTAHNGTVGAALTDHGDGRIEVGSLYALPGSPKGAGRSLLRHLIRNEGANWLNNFDGVLTEFYLAEGFEIESSFPWSDEYAPDGWNYERFGRPNYVEMRMSNPMEEAA